MSQEVTIVRKVLEANDRLAEELKNKFAEKNILCVNLMSSPVQARPPFWSAP